MKTILHMRTMLLSVASMASLSAMADDATVPALVLQRTDATTATFAFDTMPVVSFADADCVIASATATVTTARADVADLHFTRVEPTTDGIKAANGSTLARVGRDGATIYGVEPSAVHVCDTAGKAVTAQVSRQGEAVTVSLNALPAGIYIINYGKTSVKIKK